MKQPIPILMYHNIDIAPEQGRLKSHYVSPKSFNRQMFMMFKLGYKGLSMRELKPYLKGEKVGKVFGITFDDGYEDNLSNALPVLKKFSFSATCYVVSKRIAQHNVWCEGSGVPLKKIMTEEQIKLWIESGMELGSHTEHHVHLCDISPDLAKKELLQSKVDLEEKFSVLVESFCYPYGECSEAVVDMVRDVGYLSATTTVRARAGLSDDVLVLPRVHVSRRTNSLLFLLKCLTKYEDNRFKRAF